MAEFTQEEVSTIERLVGEGGYSVQDAQDLLKGKKTPQSIFESKSKGLRTITDDSNNLDGFDKKLGTDTLKKLEEGSNIQYPSGADGITDPDTYLMSTLAPSYWDQVKENNLAVTPETVMRLLRIAMIIVEQTNESGSNKKAFVVNLLKEIVMNNRGMLTEHKLEALNLITGNIVSDSIDFLIDASKGKFDINKVEKIAEEVAKSCFTRCWEVLSKKK